MSRRPNRPSKQQKSTQPHTGFEVLESRTMYSANPTVTGYLVDQSSDATLAKLDWSTLAHVNYFSVGADDFLTAAGPSHTSGGDFGLDVMDRAVEAAHANGKTISLVIGGAGMDAGFDSVFAQGKTNTVVNNIKSFCEAHGFDGVDFDYEPLWGTAKQSRINQFGTMLNAMNNAAPQLTISAAVAPSTVPIDMTTPDPTGSTQWGYTVPQTALAALDQINVMAYDYTLANHASMADATASMSGWTTYAAGGGVAKSKLVMGLPFYGRTAAHDDWNETMSYDQIMTAYHATGDSAGQWNFNNAGTIAAKAQFARDNQFGGVMIWELSNDHFSTGGNDAIPSLLQTIKGVLGSQGSSPSSSGFATIDGQGNVTATGGNEDDVFDLSVNGQNLVLKLDSETKTFALSSVQKVTIDGLAGDDTLEFHGPMPKPVLFKGGAGYDTLNVNSGTYTFSTDAADDNDALVVNVADGARVVFNATQHLDGLNVLGTATVNHSVLHLNGVSFGENAILELNDSAMVL